jgi:hypothetical protein
MLGVMKGKSIITSKAKPLLQHLLAGGRAETFKRSKGKKRTLDGNEKLPDPEEERTERRKEDMTEQGA